jgi:hypothetical protein
MARSLAVTASQIPTTFISSDRVRRDLEVNMADWTINSGSNPSHGRTAKGTNPPAILYFQESTAVSSAVIKYGDIVSQDTTVSTGGFRIRRAYAAGGGGSDLLAVGQHIVGVATEGSTSNGAASTNGDGKVIGVAVAAPDVEFVAYLIGNAAVSASSLIGAQRCVRYDSTNHIYAIDSTNSTAALMTVTLTGIPQGTEGDTNGPVYFKFLSSNVSEAVS